MLTRQQLEEKWQPVLDHEDLPQISDYYKRNTLAVILENTEKELLTGASLGGAQYLLSEAAPTNHTGSEIDNFDPVLISMVRRTAPNLIAHDIAGVQPMTGPTGLIFALRSRYGSQTGTEAFYNEANTQFATVTANTDTLGAKHVGTDPTVANGVANGTYNYGTGMSTIQAEALGTSGNVAWPEMAISIEKVDVGVKSRNLKAEYTYELAQDLKAVHGLDAETELSNVLSTEILAEMNRELIRTVYIAAKNGSQTGVTTAGTFDLDTDSNGRWSVEKFKGLMFQIDREANQIAKDTRRGRGNFIVCSSDVASALIAASLLDYTPAIAGNNDLMVDDTGNTFVGILNKRYKVYIDPYATADFMVVGYKGSSPWDAGIYFCPYTPLQMRKAMDPGSFQPKIGFSTRYGMVANPFAGGASADLGVIGQNNNVYFRKTKVTNLL